MMIIIIPPHPSTLGLKVFSDAQGTKVVTTIVWGNMSPGDSKDRTIYLKNTGDTQCHVKMTTSDWVPTETSTFMTLSWNRENAEIPAGSIISADLTLKVSESITGVTDFSFNVVFTVTG